MKSWIEVSEQRLVENYRAALEIIKREAGEKATLLAVIKANGYGHGEAICAPVLEQAGALWLGVTDVAEGIVVRSAVETQGLHPRILVMCGHLPQAAPAIVQHGLTPVVWTQAQCEALAQAVSSTPLPIHLEIDSGMSRQGIAVGESLRALVRSIMAEPRLRLEGVMTHFAEAEVAGSEHTLHQRSQFESALSVLVEEGVKPAWVHAGNTSTIDNGADGGTLAWLGRIATKLEAIPMVRSGLGLYGHSLLLEGLVASDGEETARLRRMISPVMAWKTQIISVNEVEPGARVGYSGTYTAAKTMRLALLPIGYADGLRRELSCATGEHGGWVMIGGKRAPIIGRISMNLTTVDVSEIPDAAVGDEVVLLGEGITAEDHAALADTIPYEILCGMRATTVLA